MLLSRSDIVVVSPALNEEPSIGRVLAALPVPASSVIVADNGSTDRTAAIARAAGAHVVHEPRRSHGAACLAALTAAGDARLTVFLDQESNSCRSIHT